MTGYQQAILMLLGVDTGGRFLVRCTDRWNDCPYFRDMVARGEIPADYIGRRTVMIHAPIKGTVLLTEGYHFTVGDEEGRQYL